jgi:hypothetical protein
MSGPEAESQVEMADLAVPSQEAVGAEHPRRVTLDAVVEQFVDRLSGERILPGRPPFFVARQNHVIAARNMPRPELPKVPVGAFTHAALLT